MSKDAAVERDWSFFYNVIQKWHDFNVPGEKYENHILGLQKQFKKFYPNVYILNRKALIIQHFYFKYRSRDRKAATIHPYIGLNSSQVFFKPKYSLNNSKLNLNGHKKSLKPPKVLK